MTARVNKSSGPPYTKREYKAQETIEIPVLEWDAIKSRIKGIKTTGALCWTLGLILLGSVPGAGISLLVALSSELDKSEGKNFTLSIILGAGTVALLLCGIFALVMGRKQKKLRGERFKDVLGSMDLIDARFETPNNLTSAQDTQKRIK